MSKNKLETPEQKADREIVETMAMNIAALAKRVESLLNGPLKKKALVILLAHSSGQSQKSVEAVLNNPKNIMSKDNIVRKEYKYSQNDINLSFTLRQDVKQEMKIFLGLLKVAIAEVEEDLKKLGK